MSVPEFPEMYRAEPDRAGTWGLVVLVLAGELAAGGLLLAWVRLGAFEPSFEGRAEARIEDGPAEPLLDAVAAVPQRRSLRDLSMRDLGAPEPGKAR